MTAVNLAPARSSPLCWRALYVHFSLSVTISYLPFSHHERLTFSFNRFYIDQGAINVLLIVTRWVRLSTVQPPLPPFTHPLFPIPH